MFARIAQGTLATYLALNLLLGAIGIIVHGVLCSTEGPGFVKNQYLGLWLTCQVFGFALCTAFYSLLLPWLQEQMVGNFCCNKNLFCKIVYFLICAICLVEAVLLFIGYAMAKRPELLFFTIVLNVLLFASAILALKSVLVKITQARQESYNNLLEPAKSDTVMTEASGDSKVEKCSKVVYVLSTITVTLLQFALIIALTFSANGAMILGVGTLKFPPRGNFTTVTLPNFKQQRIHYLCEGPKNSSFPVFIWESDGSHGYADFFGVQDLLVKQGRRSCIFDKPGLGYSDYLYSGQYDHATYYHQFITSIGEQPPFAFIGWGGVHEYAVNHPEMVHSMVYLDVYGGDTEYAIPALLKNWTRQEMEDYRFADVQKRFSLFDAINAWAVPWGIMGMFLPVTNNWPPERDEERRFFFLTDKTWTTQRHWYNYMVSMPDNLVQPIVNASIPIHLVYSAWNDTTVREHVCEPRKLTDAECALEIEANRLAIQGKLHVVPQNGGMRIPCTAAVCDLGYFIYGKPVFTIDALATIYANTTLQR